MKRTILSLVVLAALVVSASAQTMGRWAPKGTFDGDDPGGLSVLVSVWKGNPNFLAHVRPMLGDGCDDARNLEIRGRTHIPVGAVVPGNAGKLKGGKVRGCITIEGRFDKKPDDGWYVFNKKSGKGHWFKSCAQPFSETPPEKPEIPVYETDFENKIDIDLTFNFELKATATAESEATANARGGNAIVYMPPPMPQYFPRRELARAGTEMYQAASIGWVAVPRMTQNNNQQQQQQQQQWQQQWQEQWQEMQQQLELWIKNHGGG